MLLGSFGIVWVSPKCAKQIRKSGCRRRSEATDNSHSSLPISVSLFEKSKFILLRGWTENCCQNGGISLGGYVDESQPTAGIAANWAVRRARTRQKLNCQRLGAGGNAKIHNWEVNAISTTTFQRHLREEARKKRPVDFLTWIFVTFHTQWIKQPFYCFFPNIWIKLWAVSKICI